MTDTDRAVWSIKQGDDWRREWTTTDDVSSWDEATLLVQLRAGPSKDDTLLASSDPSEVVVGDDDTDPVGLIDTTGTSFTGAGGTLALHIDDAVTSELAPSEQTFIEAQCEIDGDVTTFLPSTRCPVVKQVAASGGGS